MKNIIRLSILIASYVLCFWFGWSVENKNTVQINKTVVSLVEASAQNERFDAKHNLELLYALKEKKLLLVEEFLANDLVRYFRTPRTLNNEGMIDSEKKIYEKARKYQQLYCSDNCLGVEQSMGSDSIG